MTEPRIVSLIASATEIVCGLGFEDCMVGRSHECDFPPSVESLPVCSSSKVDVDGSSRAIDDPDVIAVMPCGFDIPRTAAEMPPLAAHPGWAELSAVQSGRVFLTDGNQCHPSAR